MTDHRDDALRALLRTGDPASSLPTADPARVARLLEDTMSHDTLSPQTRETGARGRGPLTWLVAAAAAAVILGVGLFAVLGDDARDDGQVPAAGDAGPADTDGGGSSEETVTALTAPAGQAGRCMVPKPEVVAQQDVAFEGTVTSIEDGTVVLDPSTFYAGPETDVVTVEAPAEALQQLLVAVDFQVGETYLVSATGGQVTLCGFTGPVTPALESLYAEAFGA